MDIINVTKLSRILSTISLIVERIFWINFYNRLKFEANVDYFS